MLWFTPIKNLPLVGPVYAKRLEKLDILTIGDLLTHLPTRYEDYSLISTINKLQEAEIVTVIGKLTAFKNIYTRNRKQIQIATLEDNTGKISAIWFNQPFIQKALQKADQIAVSGRVTRQGWQLQIESPEYEIIQDDRPLIHTGRLVPVYPETAGISSKWLRSRIYPVLSSMELIDYLPNIIINRFSFPDLKSSLFQVHFPKQLPEVTLGRQRLAFDELFLLQLEGLYKRREWSTKIIRSKLIIDEFKINEFIKALPFTLTASQVQVTQQILADLKSAKPMNRLLEGDVGSGKTVVAGVAIYAVYLNHLRSLFMVPTEILAEQHFQTLLGLLSPLGLKVGIQTGAKKISKNAEYDVIVGTHALIENKFQPEKVGLVIIDEQHRFGVKQRGLLREKGQAVHVLTMTATPIPRTMVLTHYGDLDLSVLNELPKGRKSIKTWVVPSIKRHAAYQWIKKQIKNTGQQAFIVCPFIEQSETLSSVKAATVEFNHLRSAVFPDLNLGLLHGRLKSTEKEELLDRLNRKKIDILVTTSVVEVGIDISTATIILIEAAERFGLAQLHQLRGRVGRSNLQSYCLLFTSDETKDEVTRLKYLEKDLSGPELSEIDLKIRGPGSVYGVSQHGHHLLKIASYSDANLLESVKREAEEILRTDPRLSLHPLLKERLGSGTIQTISPD